MARWGLLMLGCASIAACATESEVTTDAGSDVALDHTVDAPADAKVDQQVDASSDAGTDADDGAIDDGSDDGSLDAGTDAPFDGGTPDGGSICGVCPIKETCCTIPKAIDYGKCYSTICLACCM